MSGRVRRKKGGRAWKLVTASCSCAAPLLRTVKVGLDSASVGETGRCQTESPISPRLIMCSYSESIRARDPCGSNMHQPRTAEGIICCTFTFYIAPRMTSKVLWFPYTLPIKDSIPTSSAHIWYGSTPIHSRSRIPGSGVLGEGEARGTCTVRLRDGCCRKLSLQRVIPE